MKLKDKLNKVYEAWGLKAVSALRNSLKSKGVTYPGGQASQLIGSAEIKISEKGMTVNMFDYWKQVDQGRRAAPISEEGRKNITRWVKRRGLSKKSVKQGFFADVESISFVIARKISKKGYKGKFFVEDALTDKLIKNLEDSVSEIYINHIIDDINDNNT